MKGNILIPLAACFGLMSGIAEADTLSASVTVSCVSGSSTLSGSGPVPMPLTYSIGTNCHDNVGSFMDLFVHADSSSSGVTFQVNVLGQFPAGSFDLTYFGNSWLPPLPVNEYGHYNYQFSGVGGIMAFAGTTFVNSQNGFSGPSATFFTGDPQPAFFLSISGIFPGTPFSLTVSPFIEAPESSSLVLCGLGLIGFSVWRRPRTSQRH